ncbi:hypothetical protein IPZ58_24050 [Streptomyces roseoverticillatus]|uniref:hypothetical protein n=1 Tax=Streptomyces roseoverticillatus TaxID=66429 RepID=UPI001F332A3E|nr:hypothetical protein [Streptomyces roseoverticillatus]MCF3104640.1 hypothetical protein [Streptomyces roseoverticillatus]
MYVSRTLAILTALGTAAAAAVVLVAAGAAPAGPDDRSSHGPAFAQLSSAVDQVQDGTVKTMQFELDDGHRGIDIGKDSVTVQHAGTYLVVVAPQVTTDQGGVQQGNDPTEGCVDTWSAVNGKAVANSSARLCQAATHSTHVVVSQFAAQFKKGDVLQAKTKGETVRLDATRPADGPLIPSVILTVMEVT